MKHLFIFISFLHVIFPAISQESFPPAAGLAGSTAIYKDSSIFKGWAVNCIFERGYINISDTSVLYNGSNKPNIGSADSPLGKADGSVLSLGDGGIAILTFSKPIGNGEGADIAVFENGFEDASNPGNYFLELAFVEVSSDGERYVCFPSISLTPVDSQLPAFGYVDATLIHNLAGKYAINYGVPFDLEDVKDSAGIDVNHITHVKVQDVTGCIMDEYAGMDSRGNKINDPWPTPYNNAGFDLDAVGVIHYSADVLVHPSQEDIPQPYIYPNRLWSGMEIHIELPEIASQIDVRLIDMTGMCMQVRHLSGDNIDFTIRENVTPGIYFIQISTPENLWVKKILIQD